MHNLCEYDLLDGLLNACRKKDLKSVVHWCSLGASVNEIELPNDFTPLTEAAYSGSSEICAFLVAKGANINWTDKTGFGALDRAIRVCDSKCVKTLLDLGADPNSSGNDGWSCVMTAAITLSRWEDEPGARFEIVESLVSAGSNINVGDHLGQTALMYAAEQGDLEMCQLLLELKADPNITNIKGGFAIDYAKGSFKDRFGKLIIEHAGE